MREDSGYSTQASDTSLEADRLLIDAYRRMSAAEKAQRVTADCLATEVLTLAGLRSRFPHAGEREIRLRLAALRFGTEIAETLYRS
jgi:hypothetical protein